jgi:hypothetical protein
MATAARNDNGCNPHGSSENPERGIALCSLCSL